QMVSWYAFVQHVRDHVAFGAARQVVDICLEVACPGSIRSPASVLLGVIAFRSIHGADAIRKSWQVGKQSRQLRVDPLGDVTITGKHSRRSRVMKFSR